MIRTLRQVWTKYRLRHWIESGDTPQFEISVAAQRRRGTRIGRGVRLLGKIDPINPHLVNIGDYSVIGGASALLTHCPIRGGVPVNIGSFVYLSYGVLVLPGVSIGDYVVVGAGAVVTRSVKSGKVIAGNPARILRDLTEEERLHIRHTLIANRRFGEERQ